MLKLGKWVGHVEWHTFLWKRLGPQSVVIDLGANKGLFAQELIRKIGCRCYAVDANPYLLKTIPDHPQLEKMNYAVCRESGPVEFHLADNNEASSLLRQDDKAFCKTISVEGITFSALIEKIECEYVDLLKVDIEGAEVAMFDSVSDDVFKRIGQITIEFHDFCDLTDVVDIQRINERFERLGFYVIKVSGRSYLDTLYVNKAQMNFNRWDHFVLLAFKYIQGLRRVITRGLGKN